MRSIQTTWLTLLPALALLLAAPSAARAQALPPGAEGAVEALESSPRHGEWVTVQTDGESIRSWIVYPERSDDAPVVVVIHEIYGLTGWLRSVADALAAQGYIAIAPDLVTGADLPVGPDGDPERDAAVAAIRALDDDVAHRRIRAVAEYAMALPSAQPRYAVIGFCWGGSTAFAHATRYPDLAAAVVYYGSSPEEAAMARVETPVLGLYGGDDQRVNSTIPRAEEALPDRYAPFLFDGAGHGFLRQQDGRDGANVRASEKAWPLTIGFLKGVFLGDAPPQGGV